MKYTYEHIYLGDIIKLGELEGDAEAAEEGGDKRTGARECGDF